MKSPASCGISCATMASAVTTPSPVSTRKAAAVAGLRHELGSLHGAVQGLGGSLHAYAHGLQETQEALAGAGEQARQLETTADALLAAAPH